MSTGVFATAAIERNPAWAQLLGLCPLLAVSNSLVNALGLALASGFVMLGSSLTISLLRGWIPPAARLPCFVLVIATFTTVCVLLLEAHAFELYLRVALFIQIIVSNCMILGRIEAFASRQPPGQAALDALGTACGFAIALVVLGGVRELLGNGTLFAGMAQLFGPAADAWAIEVFANGGLLVVLLPPGAFLVAGMLLGIANWIRAGRGGQGPLHDVSTETRGTEEAAGPALSLPAKLARIAHQLSSQGRRGAVYAWLSGPLTRCRRTLQYVKPPGGSTATLTRVHRWPQQEVGD